MNTSPDRRGRSQGLGPASPNRTWALGALCAVALAACAGSGRAAGGDAADGGGAGGGEGNGGGDTGSTQVLGYLWYGGGAVSSFTPDQVASSNDDNPGILGTVEGIAVVRDVALDRSGNVWAVGLGTSEVYRFPASALQSSGTIAPDLVITSAALQDPSNLAFDPNGNLWVADRRGTASQPSADGVLLRFDGVQSLSGAQALSPALQLGSSAGGPLYVVGNIAFDASGNLWATSWPGIVRFDDPLSSSGEVTRSPDVVVQKPADRYFYAIAFDAAGALWAATAIGFGMNSVEKFANPGSLPAVSTPVPDATIDKGDGWSGLPAGGLAFDDAGDLWMLTGSAIVKYAAPASFSGTVNPSPAVRLGLRSSAIPSLNAHLILFPAPPGLPVY